MICINISQTFPNFFFLLPATSQLPVEIGSLKTVYKTGETIDVSCVVFDNELVNLEWSYPGKVVNSTPFVLE